MSKTAEETYKKAKWWQKLLGIPAIVALFVLWAIDRFIHIFLPHSEHKSWKKWILDPSSFKLTIARIIIFSIPIIVYKIFF